MNKRKLFNAYYFLASILFAGFVVAPSAFADAGYAWTDDSTLSGNSGIHQKYWASIASSSNGQDLVAVAYSGGVWTSNDSGTSWTDDSTLPGNSGLAAQHWIAVASSANGQDLSATAQFGDIWTSSDGGTTWTDDSTLSGNSGISGQDWASITSSANGQYLAAIVIATNSTIWTSANGGTTWTDDSTLSGNSGISGQGWTSIASSSNGQDLVAVSNSFLGGGDIWTSTNGGTTWTDDSILPGNSGAAGQQWLSVASSADGQSIIAGNTGYLVVSHDGGAHWTTATPTGNWYAVASSADGQDMSAVSYGGSIWTSSDGGITWTDDSTLSGNSSVSGQDWVSITSSANGQYLFAVPDDSGSSSGDIWAADDPSLAPPIQNNSQRGDDNENPLTSSSNELTNTGANIGLTSITAAGFIVLAVGVRYSKQIEKKHPQ